MLDQAREAARGSQQAVNGAITEKHGVFLAEVLVDADVVLILGLVVGSRIDRVIPVAIQHWTRWRKHGMDIGNHSRIDEVRWDLISRKWIANVLTGVRWIGTSRKRVIDLRRETALVTSQLCRCRNLQQTVAVLGITEALVSKIEEGLVPAVVELRNPHRPTERGAELVLPEWCDFLQEGVAGIEGSVANVFPGSPVVFVGAGLGDHVDDATKYRAELSAIGVGNDLELLYGVYDGWYRICALEGAEVIQTIGEKEVATVRLTVNRRKDERGAHGNRGTETAGSSTHTVLRHADGRHARSQR